VTVFTFCSFNNIEQKMVTADVFSIYVDNDLIVPLFPIQEIAPSMSDGLPTHIDV
jgi:hypothetical protein